MNPTTLATIMAQLEAKLLEATLSPKPSYTIDGQSVQWNEYLKMLMDAMKEVSELIAIASPVEVRSVAG